MKFLTAALTTMVAFSDAKRLNLKNQKVDTAKIMRSAVKVDPKTHRKLDQNNGFEITSSYSIRFNSCTSLTMSAPDEDVMFGDLIEYTKQGQIVAEKSYILFNVCQTDDCSYYADDDALYMVEMAVYMEAMTQYLPTQRMNYCQACEESQEYCEANAYQANAYQNNEYQNNEYQQQDGEEGDQDNGEDNGEDNAEDNGEDNEEDNGEDGEERRKLQQNNFEVVDCDECEARGCFVDEYQNANNNGQQVEVNDETVSQWVQEVAGCQQTEGAWDNYALYAGFICNGDGDGVDIGIFLDEDCSIYTSAKSYKNFVDANDVELLYSSQEIVTYPFLNYISCAEQVEYITPEEYEEMQANGENGNQDNENNYEANEFCKELMNGEAANVFDCDADGEEDEGDDVVEEDAENNYDWYVYTLAADNAENVAAVCEIVQTMEGEYTVVFNGDEESGSGSFYSYSTGSSGGKKKGLMVTLIILGVVAIVAGALIAQGSSRNSKRGEGLL